MLFNAKAIDGFGIHARGSGVSVRPVGIVIQRRALEAGITRRAAPSVTVVRRRYRASFGCACPDIARSLRHILGVLNRVSQRAAKKLRIPLCDGIAHGVDPRRATTGGEYAIR